MNTKILQNTEPILIEFIKTVKAIHLYPDGHPNLEAVLNKAFSEIKTFVQQIDNHHITWKIDANGFYEGKMPLGITLKGIDAIAREFFARRINEVSISKDLLLSDLKGFLNIMKMKPEESMSRGGIENVLYKAGIKEIWVNEVPYEKLAERLTAVQDKKENMERLEKESYDENVYAHHKQDEEKTIAEGLENKNERKDILKLLSELEREYKTPLYLNLTDKIVAMAKDILTEQEKEEEMFSVITVFARHAYLSYDRPDEQKTAAQNGAKELLLPETIKYLISRFCKKDEGQKDIIQEVFIKNSGYFAAPLVNTLIEAEDLHIRKCIFNILIMLGEDARTKAESLLNDNRWFVVRQMTSVLGYIGSPKSFEKLKPLLDHDDIRIKKEALGAIAKIPLQESLNILTNALKSKEREIVLHAILLLGSLKDPSSLPFLMQLALQKSILHDNTEIRKEALRAVINIGDEGAVEGLADILKSRVFFKKEQNEELKALALAGIAKIGGKKAVPVIEDALRNAKDTLKERCEQMLKEIKYGQHSN